MKGSQFVLRLVLLAGLLAGCAPGVSTPTPTRPATPEPTPVPEPAATPTTSQERVSQRSFALPSECTRANYRIYVSLPAGYDPAGSERYPVIYLLDADWYFDGSHWRMGGDGVAGIVAGLSAGGEIPDAILVGIGYMEGNGRDTDFLWRPDLFYRFLIEELIPLLETEYAADTAAGGTLIGHSDGGYFTLYALFRYEAVEDVPFTRFVAISGDYTKNGRALYADELRLYQRLEDEGSLDVALYMTVGGREEARFVTSNRDIAERLNGRQYEGFHFTSEEYVSLTHRNTLSPGVVNGLKWVFQE